MLHRHKFRMVSSQQAETRPYVPGQKPGQITTVLYVCPKCKAHKTDQVPGNWTFDELMGETTK